MFYFTRILQFFWDLGLTVFDISKDAVFGEILVFSNIFGFPAVNKALKCIKTVNSVYVPFESKFKNLKDFLNSVYLVGDYL